jgi:hypothetical protein
VAGVTPPKRSGGRGGARRPGRQRCVGGAVGGGGGGGHGRVAEGAAQWGLNRADVAGRWGARSGQRSGLL